MELWSDGKETIVLDDSGLTFFSGDEVEEICTPSGDPATLGPRKGLRASKHRIFAVNPAARTALVGEPGEIPYFFDLSRKEPPRRLGFKWAAAEYLRDQLYFAVLPENEKLYFRFVELGPKGAIVDEIEPEFGPVITVEAGPLHWSSASPEPLGAPVEAIGPFTMQKNRWGFAVADLGAGLVLFAAPGEKKFSLVLRFPVTGDESLLACPLPDGICVSGSIRENHSVLAFFDRQGVKRHEITTFEKALVTGGGMPFVAADGQVAWPHSTNYGAVFTVDSGTGAILGECRIPGGSAFNDSALTISDDLVFLGSRTTISRLKKTGPFEWTGEPLDRKTIPKRIREQHTPVGGAPLLQLKPLSEPWKLPVGEKGVLAFELSNGGGETVGLEIELSGDVIEKNLVEAVQVRAGQAAGRFARVSDKAVSFKDASAAVPAATEKGTKRTKIEPSVVEPFELELTGKSGGAGFLMVRVRTGSGVTAAIGKALQIS